MASSDDLLDIGEESAQNTPRSYRGLSIVGVIIFIAIVLVVSFELVYAGKIYPGVSANGVYLGGLTRAEADAKLAKATADYSTSILPITYNNSTLHIPLKQLKLSYDPKVAATAIAFGRSSDLLDNLHAQLRALIGKNTPIISFSYPSENLNQYVLQLADEIDAPVQNAGLTFNDHRAQVTPAKTGHRLDLGILTNRINDALGTTSSDAVAAPIYELEPSISTESLTAAAHQADSYIASPISITINAAIKMIGQATIISWLSADSIAPKTTYFPDFYPSINSPSAKVGLDAKAITKFVSDLAAKLDQTPQNASLTVRDGAVAIAQESHDGIKLNQVDAVNQITTAITAANASHDLILKAEVAKATISSETLATLGLTERISSATTYFPGSPYNRLTNVRVGASHFNGVILAPGEQFSFGKILGYVGPENGYTPGLIILNNHEEKAYGGGLCQVSSTAYRAALLAGLPITERYNHSFAISYYTAPYGVPGVDATIYYPDVDMKFINDTGHYIFIQTYMQGSTLTFDYYGTKTKSGQIRGPFFIDGNADETKPSTTVFYRDVLDLAGNVTKTDTVTTHYKSSLDYPVRD